MKFAVIAIVLAIMTGVAWPLASAIMNGGPSAAQQLVEEAERTQNKAEDLNDSYEDIIPPAPGGPELEPQPPGAGTGTGTGTGAAPETTPTAAEATRTPTDGEHEVQEAMELLAVIHLELNPRSTEYTMAVEQLKNAWEPRYERAVDEFHRFEERVERADEIAQEYLNTQMDLTREIQNPEKRAMFQNRDYEEMIQVIEWIAGARGVLSQARAIKADLDDMNIIITKSELSATFASVRQTFYEIPPAIALLNQELTRFQEESEQIYKTFGSK